MNTPIIIPLTPVTLTSVILSFFKPSYQKLEAPDEKVSVIIPAYNEEKNIITCMDSLVNQTKMPDEIIVSNNGSTDATKKVIEDYLKEHAYTLEKKVLLNEVDLELYQGGKINFKVIDHKQKTSKSGSINFAKDCIENSRVMVVDSDTYFLKDFLKEASKCFYIIYKPKKITKNVVVEKISAISGTVLSNHQKDAKWQERCIARARTIEYNMGQFLTKLGQNKLAIYVVSGCGFVADKESLQFDSETVTEDMGFTWKVQCMRKEDKPLSLEELTSLNLYTLEGKNLAEELKDFEGRILFRDKGRILYQPSAFMVTQDPNTLKGLAKQLDRWKGGLHQNLFLEGKNLREKNKTMALITYSTKIEGLFSGLYLYALPLLVGLAYTYDIGVNPQTPLYMMGLDLIVRTFFASSGTYRCNKELKEKHPILKTIKQTATNLPPYYLIEFFNSFEFLKTHVRTAKEVYFNKKRSWNTSWERVNEAKK